MTTTKKLWVKIGNIAFTCNTIEEAAKRVMRQCHRCGCEIDDLSECCPGCLNSAGELITVEISKEEIAALEKCDSILDGLQTQLRGGCKVKTIRALIAKRLDAPNTPR